MRSTREEDTPCGARGNLIYIEGGVRRAGRHKVVMTTSSRRQRHDVDAVAVRPLLLPESGGFQGDRAMQRCRDVVTREAEWGTRRRVWVSVGDRGRDGPMTAVISITRR